ncbi:hypothetical protein ZWY2020_018413 [Hordeum vulgare]|nr:hypothetical protein ZWY2020_018413 [Hordeum vulgare]
MAGTTEFPPSLLPCRSAADNDDDLHSCFSRVCLNPTLMANPAAAKRPKRPGSERDVQPPAPKRVRGVSSGGELHVAVATNIKNSSELLCPSSGKDQNQLAIKNQVVESPESATQTKPQLSMRELIAKARLRGLVTEARRKLEQMTDTVQFNDPWIHYSDVTKSPEELLQARQEAWFYQAWLIEMARQRDYAEAMQIHG